MKPVRCPLHPRYWGIRPPSRVCARCDCVYIARAADHFDRCGRVMELRWRDRMCEMAKLPSPWLTAIKGGKFPAGTGRVRRSVK